MDDEIKSTRLFAHYWGTVTDNKDPLRLGRVRAYVPGVTKKETYWALPVGQAGASFFRKGSYRVPKVGAQVQVGFALGDFDQPYYQPGPFFQDKDRDHLSTVPRIVHQQTVEKAPTVDCLLESDHFEVYVVDNDDEQRLLIADLEGANGLEFNLKTGCVRLRAANWLILEGKAISIKGMEVQIQGRTVNPYGAPNI